MSQILVFVVVIELTVPVGHSCLSHVAELRKIRHPHLADDIVLELKTVRRLDAFRSRSCSIATPHDDRWLVQACVTLLLMVVFDRRA